MDSIVVDTGFFGMEESLLSEWPDWELPTFRLADITSEEEYDLKCFKKQCYDPHDGFECSGDSVNISRYH